MISLFDLPHLEAKRLVATGAPVYLGVNPVEYHGPHLSLHNDKLISEGLSKELYEALKETHPDWPFLVATGLELGVEPAPGPGSRESSYWLVRRAVLDSCRALAELGVRRVLLMTFHGSPLHNLALEAGAEWLRAHGILALAPLHLILQEMLTLEPSQYEEAVSHIEDRAVREEVLSGLALDFHGGFFETSLALYYAPDSVLARYRELPPCQRLVPEEAFLQASRWAERLGQRRLSRELYFAAYAAGWYKVEPFPGYTSWPSLASEGAGRFFAKKIIERYTESALAVFEQNAPPPLPVMRWILPLTAGGVLFGMKLPTEFSSTL